MEKFHHFERLTKQWNRLLREVLQSPLLEVLKRHVDVVLSNMAGLVVGLDIIKDL